jgi:hypothetical protein
VTVDCVDGGSVFRECSAAAAVACKRALKSLGSWQFSQPSARVAYAALQTWCVGDEFERATPMRTSYWPFSQKTALGDVEFATMSYVDWFNNHRLHGQITTDTAYATPADAEAAYYRPATTAAEAVTQ